VRKLVVVTKAASRGDAERCFDYPNHAGNRKEDRITEDYKPYAIRMKEARAEARAQRKAEKAAWKRMIALDGRMSPDGPADRQRRNSGQRKEVDGLFDEGAKPKG
jgi:hypothetical protein